MSLAGYCGGRYAAEECRLTGISNSVGSSTVPTQINLWYGNYQTFGANGVPQQWVNILGNVTSSVGTMLTYSLNGAPEVNLNWAPAHPRLVIAMLRYFLNRARKVNLDWKPNPRLVKTGDFNADIDYALLRRDQTK